MVHPAKNVTKTIPIVMVVVGIDPVEAGLVESLARPGGNVTGVTNLLQRTRWKASGAAQRSRSQSCPCRGSLQSGRFDRCNRGERGSPGRGACAGLTIQPWEVRAADGFEKVFAALNKQRSDGLYVPLAGPL